MTQERVHYKHILFDSSRWDGFEFRPDDILICTPPKCGTTWTQMICALLVLQTTTFDRRLDVISPWVDMMTRSRDDIFADLAAQEHRRFIKTHTPYDGLPHAPGVTYISVGRDPRDVFLSWDNHMSNMDLIALITAREKAVGLDDIMEQLAEGPPEQAELEIDRFWAWVDSTVPVTEDMNLASLMHNLATFWDRREQPDTVMLHYDDLTADLGGEMRSLAGRLGIEVPEGLWSELIAAASFENMRGSADDLAPETTSAIWQDNKRFFNKGTSGQWHRLLDDDGVERYLARVRELAAPDLVAWAHHEPVTTG